MQADAAFVKALQEVPNFPPALSIQGFLLRAGGMWDTVAQMNAAVKLYREVAKAGYPRGLFNLAFILAHGFDVAEDQILAKRECDKAVAAGNPQAFEMLGYWYSPWPEYNGPLFPAEDGTAQKNYTLAEEAYTRAGEIAWSHLGKMYVLAMQPLDCPCMFHHALFWVRGVRGRGHTATLLHC